MRPREEVDGMISYSSAQMFKTKAGGKLKAHVRKPETATRISEFYPTEEVVFVRDLMLSG